MKIPPLYLTYVYSTKDYENNFYHKVEISSCFEEKAFLTKEDLIKILEDDNAYFYKNSVRFFDEEINAFVKLPDNYHLTIDENDPEVTLVLLIKSRNHTINQSRFNSLQDKVDQLQIELQQLKGLLSSLNSHFNPLSLEPMVSSVLNPLDLTTYAQENVTSSTLLQVNNSINLGDMRRTQSVYPTNNGPMEQPFSQKKRRLDLAILYSDPLVKKGSIPLNDPVDFEEECHSLKRMLKDQNKKIRLRIEVATTDNLSKIINSQPVMLHFICHGDYSMERQKFYLALENNYGELEECDSDRIRKLLTNENNNSNIQIVFVNACHSEEVGRVFLEAGVPCVIAVQSELKIEDKVAQIFSKNFYQGILNQKTIREAFDNAISMTQGQQDHKVFTCCCAHKHTANCKWAQMALDEGYTKSHAMHISNCGCEKAYKHIHKRKCLWASSFIMEFNEDEDEDEEDEESCCSVPLAPDEVYICCCKKREVPHDETLKFTLMFKNHEEKGNYKVFPEEREDGVVEEQNVLDPCNIPFSEVKIFGRNIFMHKLFYFIRTRTVRFIQVSGESGVGKTEFVKQTAIYIWERKHFIEEVIYESLEGVNSLNTFMSRIRGNCPTDQKFWTVYKTRQLLFILDDCDDLIDTNGERLTKKLKEIASNTKNIKFIFITLVTKKLDIAETNIRLTPLEPIDAAKFFITHVGDLLPYKYHNPQELADHDIITQVKRIPKELKVLAQKYQQFEGSFNEFCRKILEQGLANSSNGFDIGVMLNDLKARKQEAYDFFLFLAQFPSGLLFDDLYTLASLNKIPENWDELIKALTIEKPDINDKPLSKSMHLALTKKISFEEKKENLLENSSGIIPNKYFWMKIVKDKKDGTLSLEVEHFLVKYVKEEPEHRNLENELNALEYLAHLSKLFIKQFKQEKKYFEKMIEHSKVCEEGLWADEEKNENGMGLGVTSTNRNFHKSITRALEENIDLRKSFETHKNNFYNVLRLEDIKLIYSDLVKKNSEKEELFLKSIFRLCENVPTVFKIMGDVVNTKQATELAEEAYKICNNLPVSMSMSTIIAKLNLMSIALLFNQAFNSERDEIIYMKIEQKLNDLEQFNKNLNSEIVNLEIQLIKAMILYENTSKQYNYSVSFAIRPVQKSTYRTSSFKSQPKNTKKESFPQYKNALLYIEAGKKSFQDERFKEKNKVLYGKFLIMESKIRCKLNKNIDQNVSKTLITEMEDIRRVLQEKNLIYLDIQALKCVAENMIRLSTNSQNENYLHNAKNDYCEVALEKTQKILNDKTLESECKDLLGKIHKKIRELYSNVFIFMRACPIVEAIPKEPAIKENLLDPPVLLIKKKSRENIENDETIVPVVADIRKNKRRDSKKFSMKSVINNSNNSTNNNNCTTLSKNMILKSLGFSFMMSSSFKKSIMQRLKFQITVKFEILTRKNLIDTFNKGCKIYHMNFEYENECFLLEDELGVLYRMSFSELKQALEKIERSYIDILIICTRDGTDLTRFFASKGIPYIVYFQFKPHDNVLFLKILQDICMNEFSLKFYEEIFNKCTIIDAFNHAKEAMFQLVFNKFRYFINERKMFEKILGVGPKLFPEPEAEKREAESQFLTQSVEIFVPKQYPEGHLDDISSVKAPTNIEKYDEMILGRKIEFYNIISTVYERQCVNIYGEKSLGKTKFAKLLGYFMLRSERFKDGVFYFKLKDIRKKYHSDLREYMKTVFGEEFAKEIHCYFKNKKMLLVFDDFDEILKNESDIGSYMHIFCTLKDHNIPYILVTKAILPKRCAIDRISLFYKMQPLGESDCREYLDYKFAEYQASHAIDEQKISFIEESIKKIMELSKGFPRVLRRKTYDFLEQLNSMGKTPGSPNKSVTFSNRNSKGKPQIRKDANKSTPDLRALHLEKKKADSQHQIVPIFEENEKDWKSKTFSLEEEGTKIRSFDSVPEEEKSFRGKKPTKTAIKPLKTLSYSPRNEDFSRTDSIPLGNNLNSPGNASYLVDTVTSSEESSGESIAGKKHLLEEESDDEEEYEDEEESTGIVNRSTENDEVKLVKSFSNEQKSKEDWNSAKKNDSDDMLLRKNKSEKWEFKRHKGKTSGKQAKIFLKHKKNKYKRGGTQEESYEDYSD